MNKVYMALSDTTTFVTKVLITNGFCFFNYSGHKYISLSSYFKNIIDTIV